MHQKLEKWTLTASEDDLPQLAAKIAAELGSPSVKDPFCLWLKGDLGSGKTTLTGFILRAFGLHSDMPVTSPTYTYLIEYQIKDSWFAHLDLYRAGPGFSFEDLGLTGYREYAGYFVEWPEQIPVNPSLIPPHVLEIDFAPR